MTSRTGPLPTPQSRRLASAPPVGQDRCNIVQIRPKVKNKVRTRSGCVLPPAAASRVIPGRGPGIPLRCGAVPIGMAGTRPAMTGRVSCDAESGCATWDPGGAATLPKGFGLARGLLFPAQAGNTRLPISGVPEMGFLLRKSGTPDLRWGGDGGWGCERTLNRFALALTQPSTWGGLPQFSGESRTLSRTARSSEPACPRQAAV